MKSRSLFAVVAAGFILAGCSSSTGTAPSPTAAATSAAPVGAPTTPGIGTVSPSSTAANQTGAGSAGDAVPVGQTVTLNSDRFATSVSVAGIFDPGNLQQPTDSAKTVPTTGDRFVGVEFVRVDTAPNSPVAETEEVHPSTELALVTSTGQKINGLVDTSAFPHLIGCTDVGAAPDAAVGTQSLMPGQKLVDCIVLQVPQQAVLTKVTYQDNDTDSRPGGSPAGSVATWTVGAQ